MSQCFSHDFGRLRVNHVDHRLVTVALDGIQLFWSENAQVVMEIQKMRESLWMKRVSELRACVGGSSGLLNFANRHYSRTEVDQPPCMPSIRRQNETIWVELTKSSSMDSLSWCLVSMKPERWNSRQWLRPWKVSANFSVILTFAMGIIAYTMNQR